MKNKSMHRSIVGADSIRVTKSQLVAALEASAGVDTSAAKILGISPTSVKNLRIAYGLTHTKPESPGGISRERLEDSLRRNMGHRAHTAEDLGVTQTMLAKAIEFYSSMDQGGFILKRKPPGGLTQNQLEEALEDNQGNQTLAAQALGVSQPTVQNAIKFYKDMGADDTLRRPPPSISDGMKAPGGLQKQQIESALKECEGHQGRAARYLGVSDATISKAIAFYDISIPRGTRALAIAKNQIVEALAATKGHQGRAANMLGVDGAHLSRMIKHYGISVEKNWQTPEWKERAKHLDSLGGVAPVPLRLEQSKRPQFDWKFAEKIKSKHPTIWAKGGNIRGNDAYKLWGKARRRQYTPEVVSWIHEREAWIARHYADFRLPGVIAQIKWGTIGKHGEEYMKEVVMDAVERLTRRKKNSVVGASQGVAIISLHEDSFDETRASGRDYYEILEDAEELFREGDIRIASNENFHEAIVDSSGQVLGASVVGMESGDEGTTVRFSVAVGEAFRRQGIASRLILSIVDEYKDECEIEAWVVNPLMVDLLNGLGFNEPYGGWSQDNPFFTWRSQ